MYLELLVLWNYCSELGNQFWDTEHLNELESLCREPGYVFLEMVSVM